MGREGELARVIAQEQGLVFGSFDEETAFAIGSAVRQRAAAEQLSLVVDVRLWDRPLFYCAMPGTTADNPEWVRRKTNTVRRLHRSSYRVMLEQQDGARIFPPHRALDPADHAIAGGCFPIRVKGVAGPIGAVTISGLHERDDHMVAVTAICGVLGLDPDDFALDPA
ncbi:MAG TPA: heme-degrading domain-containing protein [Alphaproteobacteria bacterium]|nr:heme-degrading domain-containing protein [Alphaproteobacteria bacterium]